MIDLFPFQRKNIDYLGLTKNVLIADEMGLGKTYQAIERDRLIRANKPVTHYRETLVIAPLVVLDSWKNHFEDLTDLKVRVIDPKKRNLLFKGEAQVYVVHWDCLRLMPELTEYPWLHVIADECHRGQNRKAKQTKALKKIKAEYKTGLSGTPSTNTPDRLWSILNWLYPSQYKAYWKWYGQYVDFEVIYPGGYHKIKGVKNEAKLHEEIKPFFVRNLKKDVLPDLPDKYYTEIAVKLGPQQARIYDDMRKQMLAWVGKNEDTPITAPIVVAQLTRLQQFADAYAEVINGKVKLSEPSAKLDALCELLEDAPGEQFVVFSQFSQMVELANARLVSKGFDTVVLTGDTPNKFRPGIIRQFQDGEKKIFLGTIGAGGIGVTLTAANKVIFLDRSWSPATNSQAEDRLHRIGQTEAVQVLDLLATGTVDLGRMQRLEEKRGWLRKLLGDS